MQTWLQKHDEVLTAFPALRQRFENAATASKAVDNAPARGVQAVKAQQNTALGRFTGDADPARTVQTRLRAPDARARMGELFGQVKDDPAALAGLRHAVMQRYLPLVQGIKFEALPKALSAEERRSGACWRPNR